MASAPFLEFGFCGIDYSVPLEVLRQVFAPIGGVAGSEVRLVAAFQLAYQGFPWQPTPEYEEGAPREKRRYGGLVYPAWSEVDAFRKELPAGTLLSFHLNETPKCPYVSGLLRGEPDVLKLVGMLVEQYAARHVQVNLTANGVAPGLFTPPGAEGEDAAGAEAAIGVLRKLCTDYPDTVFVVPIAQLTRPDGVSIDTLAFFKRLLAAGPVPANLCAFFDSSAGTGKEPDAAPEIPAEYPQGVQQRVGFTGGIHAGNVKVWLDRYTARARQHGCSLLSDAQSGFRQERNRGKPVDVEALLALAAAVREWAAEQPWPKAEV